MAKLNVQSIIDPILRKYCDEQCKVLNINVDVDLKITEHVAPGFDEIDTSSNLLEPSSVTVKMLMDSMVGGCFA